MTGSPADRLAVIGAGVSGCALVAQLRRLGWHGDLSVWETGRGPGGRASTRRSRSDGGRRLDHGAPLFNISSSPEPALLAPLLEGAGSSPGPAASPSSMSTALCIPTRVIASMGDGSSVAVAAWISSAKDCWNWRAAGSSCVSAPWCATWR
ncbi:NAD(P)-binding protein [Cyanobium sp. ATX-6F1]|uniref:NAD(P)-binding protein n=1 Tax=Cyanobium sp. ATX-6F1 TaxID=3137388 RepID=UPI0039BDE601